MACPLRGAVFMFAALTAMGCGDARRASRLGSKETEEPPEVWADAVEARPRSKDEVEVTYSLTGAHSQRARVSLEFSEDGGATYRASSTPAATLQVTRAPLSVNTVWRAAQDLSAANQHDLKLRIVPTLASNGRAGRIAESPVFGLGPSSPARVSFAAVAQPVAGGITAVLIDVSDADGDHVRITAQLSLNGGAFRDATLVEASDSFPTSPDGSPSRLVLHWRAQDDAPGLPSGRARLRLQPRDAETGEAAVTEPFELMTLAPSIASLSIDGIAPEMNGSTTFTNLNDVEELFHLLTPSSGFRLTVEASREWSPAPVDFESLDIASTSPFGRPGGIQRGASLRESAMDLSGFFAIDSDARTASWVVPAELRAPSGEVTVTATVADSLGNRSEPSALTFRVSPRSDPPAPLEVEDHWVLEFDRDHFTITATTDPGGSVLVDVQEKPDGLADYEQDLAILGLARPEAHAGSEESVLSDIVVAWTKETVRGYVYRHFGREPDGSAQGDAANIRFHLTEPGGRVSRMSIGGDDPVPGYTIGRAEFDSRNSRRNDNTSSELGIFTTNIVEYHINASYLFRSRFEAFTPGRGTPIGTDPIDRIILGDGFDRSSPASSLEANRRYDRLVDAVDAWSRMVALVTAHEIGHSLGLVANGPPPGGLFGGERNAVFAGPYTNAFHLDTVGGNIMSAALSFYNALLDGEEAPRFNALHWAYLLGRVRLQ